MKMVSDDEFVGLFSEQRKLEAYKERLEKEYISFRKYHSFNLTEFRDKSILVEAIALKRLYVFSKFAALSFALYLFVLIVLGSVADIDVIFAFISVSLSYFFLITNSVCKEKYIDLLSREICITDHDIDCAKNKISRLDDEERLLVV